MASGTLSHLHVVFSRDEGQPPDAPRYVQHAMKRHATALVNLIMKKNSSILVCGYVVVHCQSVLKYHLKRHPLQRCQKHGEGCHGNSNRTSRQTYR